MSWYDKRWHYREAVTINNTGSNTTVDLQFTVPTDMSRFWNNVASDNSDVVVTASDGKTKLDYKFSTWTYADNAATIGVKSYALPNGNLSISGKVVVIWLYWSFDDGANGTTSSGANASQSALSQQITDTKIEIGNPSRSGAQLVTAKFEGPTVTKPSQTVYVPGGTDIKTHVFFDVSPMLATRRNMFNGTVGLEEIDTFDFIVTHSDGTDLTSSMTVEAENTVLHPGFIRVTIKTVAAHVADNYLLTLKVVTDLGRIFEFYATLKARKISAPTAS